MIIDLSPVVKVRRAGRARYRDTHQRLGRRFTRRLPVPFFGARQYRPVSKYRVPSTDSSGCFIAPPVREPLCEEVASELAVNASWVYYQVIDALQQLSQLLGADTVAAVHA